MVVDVRFFIQAIIAAQKARTWQSAKRRRHGRIGESTLRTIVRAGGLATRDQMTD
jgi:hypothetical protein